MLNEALIVGLGKPLTPVPSPHRMGRGGMYFGGGLPRVAAAGRPYPGLPSCTPTGCSVGASLRSAEKFNQKCAD